MFDVTFKTSVGYNLQLRVTSRSESDYEARTRQGEQKRRWHRSIHRRLDGGGCAPNAHRFGRLEAVFGAKSMDMVPCNLV
ncbi:hypothetical protein AAG906_025212 [Vitis piasezkii]